jgi:hypothetical protein
VTTHPSIIGSWVHAHERDAAGSKCFVSVGEKLPPSRGRRKLVFNADQSYEASSPGADDRAMSACGTYSYKNGTVVMSPTNGEALTYRVKAESDALYLIAIPLPAS